MCNCQASKSHLIILIIIPLIHPVIIFYGFILVAVISNIISSLFFFWSIIHSGFLWWVVLSQGCECECIHETFFFPFWLQIKFSEFVARHIGEREGVILEAETGDFLGKHHGFWFYTIGQRQGLRLPGGPWYAFSLFIAGALFLLLCFDYWFLCFLFGLHRLFTLLSFVLFYLRLSCILLVYWGGTSF